VVRALESLAGVVNAQASFPDKNAVVEFHRERVDPEQMRQTLLKSGFVGSVLSE
jgi:copper chaperone CopZ